MSAEGEGTVSCDRLVDPHLCCNGPRDCVGTPRGHHHCGFVLAGTTAGWLVVVRERDTWKEDWDGELHLTRDAAEASADGARRAGFEAHAAEVIFR